MMYDYLVVGAGLAGCTFAYMAKQRGKKVLVIEKRNHIGGNCYVENVNGIHVHKYGAHIIYTGIIKQAMDSNGDIILFMSEYTYTRWCKGRTYYDDIDKCYKHSGCKVSKEIAEQYEHEELKRNLQKHIDIYENLC